jgi:hypothetical protein
MGEAGLLRYKFLCRDHFLPTDFVKPEGTFHYVVWMHHFMNNTVLCLHGWLEIKWHHFELASVLFRFELQQVISAVVYIEVPVPSVATVV